MTISVEQSDFFDGLNKFYNLKLSKAKEEENEAGIVEWEGWLDRSTTARARYESEGYMKWQDARDFKLGVKYAVTAKVFKRGYEMPAFQLDGEEPETPVGRTVPRTPSVQAALDRLGLGVTHKEITKQEFDAIKQELAATREALEMAVSEAEELKDKMFKLAVNFVGSIDDLLGDK